MIGLLATSLALVAASPAAQPGDVAGRWLTADGKSVVEVGRCGAEVCGRVVRVLDQSPDRPRTDINNRDKAKRSQPIEGMTVLSGFKPDGAVWRGFIYDPKSGKSYRSVLQRKGGSLSVRGCLGVLCQTQQWTAAR